MHLKRPVDELSIEELERIIAIRKREARLARLHRYAGRRLATPYPLDHTLLKDETPERISLPSTASEPAAQDEAATLDDGLPHFEDEWDSVYGHRGEKSRPGAGHGGTGCCSWSRFRQR